jgi:hypothetical protein
VLPRAPRLGQDELQPSLDIPFQPRLYLLDLVVPRVQPVLERRKLQRKQLQRGHRPTPRRHQTRDIVDRDDRGASQVEYLEGRTDAFVLVVRQRSDEPMVETKHAREEAHRLQAMKLRETRQYDGVCNVDPVETHALERVRAARQQGEILCLAGITAQRETDVFDVKVTELGHAEGIEEVSEIRRLDVDARFERVDMRKGHGLDACWINVLDRGADTEVECGQIGTAGKGLQIVAMDRVPKRARIILEVQMLKLRPRDLEMPKVKTTPGQAQAVETGCGMQYDRGWIFTRGKRVGVAQFQALEVWQGTLSECQKTAERSG